jgi:hypothetical protein
MIEKLLANEKTIPILKKDVLVGMLAMSQEF